ncbi:MAG: hypothetical protein M1835_005166 [Candelina submexicana]|nr:MAG: hypothetical protein M1835_005166 [Candelina submexicana]
MPPYPQPQLFSNIIRQYIPFFVLPGEIRNQIYDLVIADALCLWPHERPGPYSRLYPSVIHIAAHFGAKRVGAYIPKILGLRMANKQSYADFTSQIFTNRIYYVRTPEVPTRYTLRKTPILQRIQHLCIDLESCIILHNHRKPFHWRVPYECLSEATQYEVAARDGGAKIMCLLMVLRPRTLSLERLKPTGRKIKAFLEDEIGRLEGELARLKGCDIILGP